MPRAQFAPTRRRRSPAPLLLAIAALLLAGLLVYAYFRDSAVAPARIEQDVTNEVLAN